MINDCVNSSKPDICKTFDEVYHKLLGHRDGYKIKGLFSDEKGLLLLDAFEALSFAPQIGSIAPVDSVFTSNIDNAPTLVYTFHYNSRSMGENVLVFLVRTKERKIRLFAVESHCGCFYLCEYDDNKHINYGEATPEEIAPIIAKKLTTTYSNKAKMHGDKHTNVNYSYDIGEFMSKTGDWGDKLIITLHSDRKRRHKKWCDHYRDDNHCAVKCEKCTGSAHCSHYKNNSEDGSDIFYLVRPAEPDNKNEDKSRQGFALCEYYRLASYGDRLLHKTVLVKNTPHTFSICEVIDEDFYHFVVEYGGKNHKYSKRVAYRNNSVYIFLEFKSIEITEDL